MYCNASNFLTVKRAMPFQYRMLIKNAYANEASSVKKTLPYQHGIKYLYFSKSYHFT